MTKMCKRCKREKSAIEFNKESRVKDGLTATCKACNKELGTQWAREHREQYNEIQARWCAAHPEKTLAKGRDWRAANRKRSNALLSITFFRSS